MSGDLLLNLGLGTFFIGCDLDVLMVSSILLRANWYIVKFFRMMVRGDMLLIDRNATLYQWIASEFTVLQLLLSIWLKQIILFSFALVHRLEFVLVQ